MSNTIKAVLGVVTVFFVIFASFVGYGVSVYNQANGFEKSLGAEKENNRNILSNYGKKLVEAAQITDMQRDDFLKIVTAQMEGRYGAEGSKATFQFLTEQNANLDPKVYQTLQRLIEAGRNEFATGQTKLISVKQGYQTVLGSAPRGFVMGLFGYPKINLADFDIVSDDRTEKAFADKKENAIKLR